jgi:hypothetical protein
MVARETWSTMAFISVSDLGAVSSIVDAVVLQQRGDVTGLHGTFDVLISSCHLPNKHVQVVKTTLELNVLNQRNQYASACWSGAEGVNKGRKDKTQPPVPSISVVKTF